MRIAIVTLILLAGCSTPELVATREGMAAADNTIHADYLRRVDADPKLTASDKAAAHATVGVYDDILADSRKNFPATRP